MATQAQIAANRLNAQKSTGPRTAEGKAVVAQNAVKHGLLAQQALVKGEDPGEFEFYRDQMLGELAPAGAMEAMLATRIVGLAWRLQRAERLQNEAFDFLYLEETANPSYAVAKIRGRIAADQIGDPIPGKIIVRDFGNSRSFERLLVYERRIEQSLYRAMAELEKLRRRRSGSREQDRPAEKPTPKPVSPGSPEPSPQAGGDGMRQTKPIGRDGSTENATHGRTPADRAKQSQSVADVTNRHREERIGGPAPIMQNKPNSTGVRCPAAPVGGSLQGRPTSGRAKIGATRLTI